MLILYFTIVCIHRKNGESDIRISKRKLHDVLGKVKKIVFRVRGDLDRKILSLEKGHVTQLYQYHTT